MNVNAFEEFRSEQEVPGRPAAIQLDRASGPSVPGANRWARYPRRFALAVLVAVAVTPWALLAGHYFNASSEVAQPKVRATAKTAATIVDTPSVAVPSVTRSEAPQPATSYTSRPVDRPKRATHVNAAPNPVVRQPVPSTATTPPVVADVVNVSEAEIVASVVPLDSRLDGLLAQPQPELPIERRRVAVSAHASDPDGDVMSFRWSAPEGTFAEPTARQTEFTCPSRGGTVPVTIAVFDAHGAVARDTITVHCVTK